MEIILNYRKVRLKCEDPVNLTGLENAPKIGFWSANFITIWLIRSVLVRGLGRESGKLEDIRASDFENDSVEAKAINSLLDWYEDNFFAI